MIKKILNISALGLLLTSPFVAGQNITTNSFQTPSGNIHCEVYDNILRCDLMSRTNKPPKKPADCPLEYGSVFELKNNKDGTKLICYGDTIASPSHPKLAYGSKWSKLGIICESETTGLTCTNQAGKGFSISKANQKLF